MPDELHTSFWSSHLDEIILGYRNLRLIKATNAPLCSIPRLSLPYFSDVKLPSSKQFLISLHILLKTTPTFLILPFKSTAFPIHPHSRDLLLIAETLQYCHLVRMLLSRYFLSIALAVWSLWLSLLPSLFFWMKLSICPHLDRIFSSPFTWGLLHLPLLHEPSLQLTLPVFSKHYLCSLQCPSDLW